MPKSSELELSEPEIEYYSRQIVLPDIGYNGQVKLKGASVCIVGLGGLGSPVALQLAAMGVGHLRLVDYDIVELSNLHRQHLYSTKFLGYPKVEAATIRLKELNPNIEVESLPLFLNQRTVKEVIKDVDVVIDGLDRMSTRYIINRACQKIGVPYIHGAAIMTFGNVSTIIPGETPCLECLQAGIDDDMLLSCAIVSVHPAILNIVASIEVSEATKIITGKKPRLAGKLLHCDISDMTFEVINISRNEERAVCGSKQAPPKPIEEKTVMELCARNGKRVFLIVPRNNLDIGVNKFSHAINGLKDFEIKVSANLGITFTDKTNNVSASILRSGIMIVDNVNGENHAYNYYREILVDLLGIDVGDI